MPIPPRRPPLPPRPIFGTPNTPSDEPQGQALKRQAGQEVKHNSNVNSNVKQRSIPGRFRRSQPRIIKPGERIDCN